MSRPAPSVDDAAAILRFGLAALDTDARALLIEGRRAALGPRAYALLKMLVDERHRAVSKQELLDTVWRGVIVEENNLQVQISTLRRLLGPNAIATIPGRGYRFMLPVEGDIAADEAESAARTRGSDDSGKPGRQAGNLPERLPELYGREAECAAVRALVEQHPLVSIVGAAGIGKTRLALAAAHATSASWPDGVWMIELHALNDPDLLVQTMAQALKAALPGVRDPAEELVTALRGQHALLLIDNCEHLIDAVGIVAERLLRGSSGLHLLVTSQEPLHLPDEQVYRLAPLSVPQEPCGRDAVSYGAVRLFFERTRALLPRFELTPENTPEVIEVCRRLDGLALAIELAAARVPVLGVSGVRERLGERFRILTGGSRIAPKRHQTLRAALDWSHALLDDGERAVYRRLGLFVGSFSLESAEELGAGGGIDPWGALEHLSSLVDRSLVIAEGEPRPRYRLLESTREHALEQLALAGETDEWLALHAAVTRRAVEQAIRERRADIVLAEMGNVRSAYDWARGAKGRRETAVALATLPSMVLAVEGAVQEAKQRLLEVEALIDDSLPSGLVAQYWQWYGRIGVDGRLPARRCVDAFRRAEGMFAALGNLRHVHACRRHGAEAMLDAGDLEGAALLLSRAEAMEGSDWPLADRMRRLRVQGLWLAKAGRTDEAVRTSMQ
ncbi:MAG TPA: winged helix-turn-helix domain-containing protein, partial [Burkholderiaceae bacterium]|nr:winged helix-turn-helix domain-containing protein [Burkholderiaceae bacterium]